MQIESRCKKKKGGGKEGKEDKERKRGRSNVSAEKISIRISEGAKPIST